MGDLAPRDVVAAAINTRLDETGDACVFLDARGVDRLEHRFPTVTEACRRSGIEPTREPIPVVPGAHYSCGGVRTDVHGRTVLVGLLAAGEVACTGMHGANRLASNSLLEGLVVGARAGRKAADLARSSDFRIAKIQPHQRVSLDRAELQQAMTRWASVVRDGEGLTRLSAVLRDATVSPMASREDFEDAALTAAARVVTEAALARTETRGCHHRSDWPQSDPAQAVTLNVRLDSVGRLAVDRPEPVAAR